ncbi:MAG: hypothetical protein ABI651_17990 [Verrucomicrobiota bacterium]
MKTVTRREAAQDFETFGDLAHAGETVVVTQAGRPWFKMVPPSQPGKVKSAAQFKARLDRISRKPLKGVLEVFKRQRR